MSPVINRIKMNLELVTFLNISLIHEYTLVSSAKLTSLELGEMPLSMSIIIIKNSKGPRTVPRALHSKQDEVG